MLTMICTIRFRDGATITATASAETPYDDVEVKYSGDVARLRERPQKCPIMFVRAEMQSEADRLRGEFTETYTGKFDAER